MKDKTLKLFKLLFPIFMITGAFTFLFAFFYWREDILYLSLVQLMSGSVGSYILLNP